MTWSWKNVILYSVQENNFLLLDEMKHILVSSFAFHAY